LRPAKRPSSAESHSSFAACWAHISSWRKWRRYLGWCQNSGGDLIQEWLENMMITPVDQRYFDIGSLERPRGRDTGEASANDQDAFFAWQRLCKRRLFLWKRFGQNCRHGNSSGSEGTSVSGMDMVVVTALLERPCGAWNVHAVFVLAWIASPSTAGAGGPPKVMAATIRNDMAPFVTTLISLPR
jgi:hypothetical protein